MKEKLITVIVPIYNMQKLLQRCIDSIISQSLEDIEIILVNDGSTDDSLKICVDNAKKDERIIVINKTNGGVASARNEGLKVARGQFISFIDPDDWIDKEMYKVMYEKSKINDSDICLCGFVIEEKNKKKYLPIDIKKEVNEKNDIINDILPRFFGPCTLNNKVNDSIEISAVRGIYKKELLDKNGIKFEVNERALLEDLPFDIKVIYYANRLCICKECFYHYYRHNESVQRKYDPLYWNKVLISCEETEKFIKEKNISIECKSRFSNTVFDQALRCISRYTWKTCTENKKQRIERIKEICNSMLLIDLIYYIDKKDIGIRKNILIYFVTKKMSKALYYYFVIFNKIIKIVFCKTTR